MAIYKENEKFILTDTDNNLFIGVSIGRQDKQYKLKMRKFKEEPLQYDVLQSLKKESIENYTTVNRNDIYVNKVMGIMYIEDLLYYYDQGYGE